MATTERIPKTGTTSTSSTKADSDLPQHKSNKPTDAEVAELNAASDEILDAIDAVLDESASLRSDMTYDDLLDEIESVLIDDVSLSFRQSGGE